jgi:hypothetical protein
MKAVQSEGFQLKAQCLEDILRRVLHDDLSFERDDLYTQIATCLNETVSFAIVIAERRRFSFSKSDTRSERLFLPFISLRIIDGKHVPFQTPRSIEEFLADHERLGFHIEERPKTIIAYPRYHKVTPTFLNICETIVLSYYYACGHFDHFMTNASRRFAKQYLQTQHSLSTKQVLSSITTQTQCDVAYLRYDIDDSRYDIVEDERDTYTSLSQSERFQAELKRASERRGTYSGRTDDGLHYVISVATMDRSYDSLIDVDSSLTKSAAGGHRIRHILVLSKRDKPLSMDAIKFGPHLFNIQLGNDAFSIREKIIFGVYRDVSQIERRFSADPPAQRKEIVEVIHSQFQKIIEAATRVTAAQLVIIRLFDPFSNTLRPVAIAWDNPQGTDDIETITLSSPDSDIVSCFMTGDRVIASQFPRYVSSIEKKDDDKKAGLIFPLMVSCVVRGTIECYSTRRAQLQFDEDYLTAISDAIGDAARRIESSADIAWISRLSFLHSARHELENFLPLLRARDEELFSSLNNTLMKYSGITPIAHSSPNQKSKIGDQIRSQLLAAQENVNDANKMGHYFAQLDFDYAPDQGFHFICSEVFSTLLSNAKRHSSVRCSDFRVELSGVAGKFRNLLLTYRSSDKRIKPQRAQRVGTSPIPDLKQDTFHYGLFLVSAQVRMNGGTVYVNTDVEEELEYIPFEICFSLPLYPLGGEHAS